VIGSFSYNMNAYIRKSALVICSSAHSLGEKEVHQFLSDTIGRIYSATMAQLALGVL
jgi:hypothetical protein